MYILTGQRVLKISGNCRSEMVLHHINWYQVVLCERVMNLELEGGRCIGERGRLEIRFTQPYLVPFIISGFLKNIRI